MTNAKPDLILVPIRFPLTRESRATLDYASTVAQEHNANIHVLHVNLFYTGKKMLISDLNRAIRPHMDGQAYSVSVRRGVLIEEIILDEMRHCGADLVILGRQNKPWWRRQLSRVIGNEPALPSFLTQQSDATIEIASES